MPSQRSPSERGNRQYMLNPVAAAALDAYRNESGGLSASVAVLRLLAALSGAVPVDLEAMFLACRVDGRTAQRIREWFGV